jgi:hypothetical protein
MAVGGLFVLGHVNVCTVVPDFTLADSSSSPAAPSRE